MQKLNTISENNLKTISAKVENDFGQTSENDSAKFMNTSSANPNTTPVRPPRRHPRLGAASLRVGGVAAVASTGEEGSSFPPHRFGRQGAIPAYGRRP